MTSFSSYWTIPKQDQLSPHLKSRRCIAIAVLSSFALITAAAVLAVYRGAEPAASSPSPSASIKSLCSDTLYPDSCFLSLGPLAANSSSAHNPAALFRLTLRAAKDAILTSANLFEGPFAERAAPVSDCRQLLLLAASHIEDCAASPSDLASEGLVDDLKTWLSAAITDHDTCVSGLGDNLDENIEGAMRNSTEMTSNSLSILNKIADIGRLLYPGRRLRT